MLRPHVNVIEFEQTDHSPTIMNFFLPKSVKLSAYKKYTFRSYSESNKKKSIKEPKKIWKKHGLINYLRIMSIICLKSLAQFLSAFCCPRFPKSTEQSTYKRKNNSCLTSQLLQQIKRNSEYFKQNRRGHMSKATNHRFRFLV